jgi:hypothetical protein
MLIVGHPVYTRSVEVVRDALWYIRNLDSAYREVLQEHVSGGPEADSASRKTPCGAALAPREARCRLRRPVPLLPGRLRPVYVTAEIRTTEPACPPR